MGYCPCPPKAQCPESLGCIYTCRFVGCGAGTAISIRTPRGPCGACDRKSSPSRRSRRSPSHGGGSRHPGCPPGPSRRSFFGAAPPLLFPLPISLRLLPPPPLLPFTDLGRMLAAARAEFGLRPDAEVTIEANPDTVGPRELDMLAAGGITRISFGMQSAVPHVLATLDRTHDPKRVAPVVTAAHSAGLAVSVDLIFGTPGESLADWQRSLDAALACRPEHISAYS